MEAHAATGIAEQYEGPFFRFYASNAPHLAQVARVAKTLLGKTASPEDYCRALRDNALTNVNSASACDYLQQYVERHEEAPFDGVLGFSEGASLLASLILRRSREKRTSLFRFAIFICGTPPFRSDGDGVILADEVVERITIPTSHIVGAKDPGYLASLALYNLCDQLSASMFDHGKAHTIPWGPVPTQGLVKEMMKRIQSLPSD